MSAIVESMESKTELHAVSDNKLALLLERESRIERAQRNAYLEIGLDLKAIKEDGLYKAPRSVAVAGRYSFTTFEEYVEERWDMDVRRVNQVIEVAEAAQKMGKIFPILPSRESHVRELLKIESDQLLYGPDDNGARSLV